MQSEIYVKEQIIKNGVPIKDVEYEKKNVKEGVFVQGHYNNNQFRYIQPLTINRTNKKRVHFSKKNQNIVFNPISNIERMPNYYVDSLMIHRARQNKSKKMRTYVNRKSKRNKSVGKRDKKKR